MLIHGFHAVIARLKRGGEGVRELYVGAGRDDARVQDLLRAAERAGVRPHFVDAARIERLCPQRRHQGVVLFAEARAPQVDLDELLDRTPGPLLLLLDGVTDPRNLGACLRVADGAGVHAVIAPKDRAVGVNATVAKVASGAADTVPYLMVTNLARSLGELRERGLQIVGTAEDAPIGLHQAPLRGPLALVLGAEGRGLRELTRRSCDQLLRIPMHGAVDSLNVAVAAGVCLYEALRQRSP